MRIGSFRAAIIARRRQPERSGRWLAADGNPLIHGYHGGHGVEIRYPAQKRESRNLAGRCGTGTTPDEAKPTVQRRRARWG
jgi:hypothetical protein